MLTVLITGGAGFLGSHLADGFLTRGDAVIALDTGSQKKVRHLLSHPRFRLVVDSVMNPDILDALAARAELIYHLAGIVGVEHYVGDPYEVLNININGTQNVLRAALKHGRRVVFASTSEVYGKNLAVPWREDADRVLGPSIIDRWCYSTSKAAGEHFCLAFRRLGLPVTILRYFNVYGPRLDQLDVGRVITIFMGQLLRGEPLTVIGDGTQTRSFTYVTDAIVATIAAGVTTAAEGQIINVGSDVETSIRDLAERMIAIGGGASTLRFVEQETVYGDGYEDVARRVPDVTRMAELLGTRATTSLDDGLAQTIGWFRRQPRDGTSVGT
jgi:nucleoside-diphosphate-sugar epimerase